MKHTVTCSQPGVHISLGEMGWKNYYILQVWTRCHAMIVPHEGDMENRVIVWLGFKYKSHYRNRRHDIAKVRLSRKRRTLAWWHNGWRFIKINWIIKVSVHFRRLINVMQIRYWNKKIIGKQYSRLGCAASEVACVQSLWVGWEKLFWRVNDFNLSP